MAVKGSVKNPRLDSVVGAGDLAGFTVVGFTAPQLNANQLKGIEEGHLLPVWSEIEISDEASPTAKGVLTEYIRLYSLDVQGISILNDGKMKPQTPKPTTGDDTRTDEEKRKGACDYHDYGHDLEVKRVIRQAIMKTLEGPEKAIKVSVVGLRGMGILDSEIPAMIKASPRWAGVEGLDAIIAAVLKG